MKLYFVSGPDLSALTWDLATAERLISAVCSSFNEDSDDFTITKVDSSLIFKGE